MGGTGRGTPKPKDPNYHDNGSGVANDFNHHKPSDKFTQPERNWPQALKAHGQVNVDRAELKKIADSLQQTLNGLKDKLSQIQSHGAFQGALGSIDTAQHYANVSTDGQSAFYEYYNSVLQGYQGLIEGLGGAQGTYTQAEVNSTPVSLGQ